jgi:hypothetical protein
LYIMLRRGFAGRGGTGICLGPSKTEHSVCQPIRISRFRGSMCSI